MNSSKYFTKLYEASFTMKLFFSGVFITIFLDGTGIVAKSIIFVSYLLLSSILGVSFLRKKKYGVIFNKDISVTVLIYIIYLLYISFFSLNIQVSFERTLFIIALFTIWIFLQSREEKYENFIFPSIMLLGILFCLYAIFLLICNFFHIYFLLPSDNYQYVYAVFGSSHLGEFLVFPTLMSFYSFIEKKRHMFLLLFSFFLVFILFSYSRTAYGGFIIGFCLLLINVQKKFRIQKHIQIIGITLLSFIVFFVVISFFKSWVNNVPFIKQNLPIKAKSIVETREKYILEGLEGFLMYRYYGVGLGNFQYVSHMFTKRQNVWTDSSHAVYLDMLTETGIVSFVVFVIFTVFLLRTIKKHYTNIYAVLLLSWFAMIQSDYLHRMNSYLFLFILFLYGLFYSSKRNIHKSIVSFIDDRYFYWFTIFSSLGLGIFLLIYIVSAVLQIKGNDQLARTVYPLQKSAYRHGSYNKEALLVYIRLFPGDYNGFYKLGKLYESEGDINDAIINYEKAFWLDPFHDLLFANKIYTLKQFYQGNSTARRFAEKLFVNFDNTTGERRLTYDQRIFLNKLCQKAYNLHCRYTLE